MFNGKVWGEEMKLATKTERIRAFKAEQGIVTKKPTGHDWQAYCAIRYSIYQATGFSEVVAIRNLCEILRLQCPL